ncbi:MAG: GNAT family protein [Candidatus Lokiarchaeia archaeon]|nr:GNAT family protein [Candidatus Lokiarchaeia archaeon]
MLEGNIINLRAMELEDIPILGEWFNNLEFQGEYTPLLQRSSIELSKHFSDISEDHKEFIIEKKDGTKIGFIMYFTVQGGPYHLLEIGYYMITSERRHGYCTEAVQIFIDFLFLSHAIERIQATTDSRNAASKRVLQKAGFSKEGIIRKAVFMKGEYVDVTLFSILREDWKEKKILKF